MGSAPSNTDQVPSNLPHAPRHQQNIHFDKHKRNIEHIRKYERNARYVMNIRDEPEQMLRPITGYGKGSLTSLEEACEPLNTYVTDLPRHVWIAKKNSQHPADGLNPDESASIHLYTMEWSDSLYIALNKTLRDVDRRALAPWFPYLKLLITALFKLPSLRAVVWRGVPEDLSNQYKVGDHKVWWSFSSCTSSMNILENPMYLGNHGTRTLFSIEAYHGKMIKNHSFYKKEDEVLLLPGTYFEITNNFDSGNNLHIIQIKQKRPPHTLLEKPFHKQETTLFKDVLPAVANPPAKIQPLELHGAKKIVFSNIPGAGRGSAKIPNGYEGFDWEDFHYVEESFAQAHRVSSWQNVFKHSRYIIHNVSGKQKMYIRSSKPNKTFTIKSMDIAVVDRGNSQWTLTGLRSNVKLFTKTVTLQNPGQYQLTELNFVDIDEMTFTTFSGYPDFVISCINLIN